MTLRLAPPEREELKARVQSRKVRAEDARRARLILMLAKGESYTTIQAALGCPATYVVRWKKRFEADRVAGLSSRYRGARVTVLTPQLEARILSWTRRRPTDGSTHWSTRRLAKALKIDNHMLVARAWARVGIKPHRFKRYMLSNDPEFEKKAADVIGLYLNPPQHAAVFCVDEKTAIQALDRLDPVLPLSPGRAERHGFEYYRHGTLSLFAALETRSGLLIGKTTARHRSVEFVGFLQDLVDQQPRGKEIHVIADNLSAHKTKAVSAFLLEHPNVHLHFTPTYSSWLNQVELVFSKIERDVISRGVFSSVNDLARKLMRYIRLYNKDPRPVRWKHSRSNHRIVATSDSTVTGH